MDDFSERILIQNLALCAEALDNSDTTSTTANLTTSLGCVVSVISEFITRESAPSTSGLGQFVPYKYQAKPSGREKNAGLDHLEAQERQRTDEWGLVANATAASGVNAALPRKNHHPTVKPVELMRWLARLVTPPGGVILDPFAGSGSTLVAATLEGFDSIGVEAEAEYLPLIEGRVRWAEQQAEQPALTFD